MQHMHTGRRTNVCSGRLLLVTVVTARDDISDLAVVYSCDDDAARLLCHQQW